MDLKNQIAHIRRFNRNYTARIGLLEKHILDSEYTLTESRIMLEIKERTDCTAKDISEGLSMDPGFVSRTIAALIKRNMVDKTISVKDKRASVLKLTEGGRKHLAILDERSDAQIGGMILDLTEKEQQKVYESITNLNEYLLHEEKQDSRIITIRNELRAGDAGRLIMMHGELYKKECGYNQNFEGYVCKTFYDVLVHGNSERDRFWLAEDEAESGIVGSIAIVARSDNTCQLRWLLVLPEYRKTGLGQKLIREALIYAENMGFGKIFLETSNEQQAAIHLYEKYGFTIQRTYEINDWGKPLTGIAMEKTLS